MPSSHLQSLHAVELYQAPAPCYYLRLVIFLPWATFSTILGSAFLIFPFLSFWIFRLEWETQTASALAESRSPPGHPQTPRQDYINLFLLHHIFKVVSIFSDDVEFE